MAYNSAIEVLIDNVGINKLATALRGITTLGGIQALNLFDQYDEPEKGDAEDALFATINSFNGIDISPVLSIAHVNGVSNAFAGTEDFTSTSVGAGTDGNGNIVLTPVAAKWKTLTVPGRLVKFTARTNIVANDVPSSQIIVRIARAYMLNTSTALSGNLEQLFFNSNGQFNNPPAIDHVISGGPTYAGNVGDNGTFWAEVTIPDPGNSIYDLGTDAPLGDYHYIFAATCPASAITKTYKFIIEIEYV